MMVFQKIMFIETNLAARNKQQIAFVQLQENKKLKKQVFLHIIILRV